MASVSVGVMENPVQLQQQQQSQQSQEALKCPRCDSSNTKFCYFNNYSLSQPRHFCKACKRYWTRGGTLRNVPVGGGCRKNKRVKRSITTTTIHVATTTTTNPSSNLHINPNPNSENLDQSHNVSVSIPSSTNGTNSNHHLNPLFYGLFSQNHNYPRFDTRVVSGVTRDTLVSRYDFVQPETRVSNATGLGFSSTGAGGCPAPSFVANHGHNSNLSNFPNYTSSLYNFGGSTSASTSTSVTVPTMASLLASSLNQQPRSFMGTFATAGDAGTMVKDLKMEETQSYRVEWNSTNNNFHDHQNDQTDQNVHVSSDPNSLIWDTEGGGGGWLDQSDE